MSYTRNSELYYNMNLACVKDFFQNLQNFLEKGSRHRRLPLEIQENQ